MALNKSGLKHRPTAATAILLGACAILVCAPDAQAYMDPGTGSYLFQLLMAALLGALFAIKMYWKALKAFFSNLFSRNRESDHGSDG